MIAGVADTHAAIWHLFDDDRISGTAEAFIDRAALAGQTIAVSTISLAGIVYLIEKNRLRPSVYDDLKVALADPDHVLKEVAIGSEIIEAIRLVPRASVPDMPDRIVAATAVHFGVPVISRDGKIRAAGLKTVW